MKVIQVGDKWGLLEDQLWDTREEAERYKNEQAPNVDLAEIYASMGEKGMADILASQGIAIFILVRPNIKSDGIYYLPKYYSSTKLSKEEINFILEEKLIERAAIDLQEKMWDEVNHVIDG